MYRRSSTVATLVAVRAEAMGTKKMSKLQKHINNKNIQYEGGGGELTRPPLSSQKGDYIL